MTTMKVTAADGQVKDVEMPLAPGRAAAIASKSIAFSTEDKLAIDAIKTATDGVKSSTDAVKTSVDNVKSAVDTLHQDLGTTIHNDLSALNTATGTKADAAWDGSAPSPSQIAIEKYAAAKLEAIRALFAASGSERNETLWTDNSGAYFVRIDTGSAISWADVSGNASSAPGAGARPAEGPNSVIDKSSYQATASGTGYSNGDYLDHFVITNPTGVVVGSFWVNLNTEAKLASAPAAANITPVQSAPAGGATSAKQDSVIANLASILAKLSADPLLSTTVVTSDGGTGYATSWGVDGSPVAGTDLTSPQVVTDPPAAGKSLVIDDLIVSVEDDMQISFVEEDTDKLILGPFFMTANSGPVQLTTRGKLRVPTINKRLVAQSDTVGGFSVLPGYHSES